MNLLADSAHHPQSPPNRDGAAVAAALATRTAL